MDYNELLKKARTELSLCHACPVCDGRACKNTIPGPGAKGSGGTAIRNYDAWHRIHLVMDTISQNVLPDTEFDFFGYQMQYPIFAGPVGAIQMHYGKKYTDVEYNDILVSSSAKAGICAFTGDGTDPAVMRSAVSAIKNAHGKGVPTVKPWNYETLKEKLSLISESDSFAVAMDIDAAGLPFLKSQNAGNKTVEELSAIIKTAGKPFIIKGIMSVKGALKARKAGASAIVVSNHGGRVLDECPATAEVLPEIVDAVGDNMMVLIDGGIRSGIDVFKAIALGAQGVLIARPFVTAIYGDADQGVAILTSKLASELKDTMKMCGCATLKDISKENIRF